MISCPFPNTPAVSASAAEVITLRMVLQTVRIAPFGLGLGISGGGGGVSLKI
jgi:hypothetical protein